MRFKPTLCILCGLAFLVLGCQAGRLQWVGSNATSDVAPAYQDIQVAGGPVAGGPSANDPGGGGPNEGGAARRPVRPVKVPYVTNCLHGSEFVARLKYHARAATAYRRYRRGSGHNTLDFQHGFEQGYIDLARGGRGRTPAVAPHQYWGPAYRSPAGQSRQQDWLTGYTAGTQMSQQDGLGQYYPVAINPEVQYYRNDSPSWAMSPGY
ncbi:MAG: hypothetical protein JWM11_4574 [Planctomycetaceae bacterium]|nr:hypothetical protein [Planctomycetaceae bacterium]